MYDTDFAQRDRRGAARALGTVCLAVPLALGLAAMLLISGAGLLAAFLAYSLGGAALLLALGFWSAFRSEAPAARRGRAAHFPTIWTGVEHG